MMYIIIIGSIVAILWILSDGLRGSSRSKTSNDRYSKINSQQSKDDGTHLGKRHTVFDWLFKSRH